MPSLESQPPICVGDWVVLKAKPPLSAPELIAIFEVLELLEPDRVLVQATGLGKRQYPVDWLLVYPRRSTAISSE